MGGMKRLPLSLVLALLALIGFAAPSSASTWTPAATFTVASTVPDAVAAASAWSARQSHVLLQPGSCAGGKGCITISYSAAALCDSTSGTVVGCASRQSDGSCVIQIASWLPAYGDAVLTYVEEHEIGHCLGLPHSSNTRSVMYPTFNLNSPGKVISQDLFNVAALYP